MTCAFTPAHQSIAIVMYLRETIFYVLLIKFSEINYETYIILIHITYESLNTGKKHVHVEYFRKKNGMKKVTLPSYIYIYIYIYSEVMVLRETQFFAFRVHILNLKI
jgi:hypothetical protein